MSLRSPTLFKWTLRWYLIVRRRETGITCLHLLHVPTFQQSTLHLLVPNLCKYQLTWKCYPNSISQTKAGCSSAWPLKYWTTASPELLEAVTMWNVRPCFLWQWKSVSAEWRTSVFHGTFLQNHLWPTYSTVWCLNWHLRRGASELNIWH